MERLALSDIMYIEQRARQIFIHLKENEEISCYEKLSDLSDQLPAELFFLPHKSYAVNLSYVTRIDTSLKCFVMADDTNIPIKREPVSYTHLDVDKRQWLFRLQQPP